MCKKITYGQNMLIQFPFTETGYKYSMLTFMSVLAIHSKRNVSIKARKFFLAHLPITVMIFISAELIVNNKLRVELWQTASINCRSATPPKSRY